MIPDDVADLRELVKGNEAKLLIIDPLVAHLSQRSNTWNDHSVRRALSALHRLAEETRIAVIAIIHINKNASSDPAIRISGSTAFRNAARSMLVFARDPEEDGGDESPRRLLAHAKSNYSPLAPTLVYEIEPTLLRAEGDKPEVTTTRLIEVGESPLGHLDVLRRPAGDSDVPSAVDAAVAFLSDELAAGAAPARRLFERAKKVGIADKTLRRAAGQTAYGGRRPASAMA